MEKDLILQYDHKQISYIQQQAHSRSFSCNCFTDCSRCKRFVIQNSCGYCKLVYDAINRVASGETFGAIVCFDNTSSSDKVTVNKYINNATAAHEADGNHIVAYEIRSWIFPATKGVYGSNRIYIGRAGLISEQPSLCKTISTCQMQVDDVCRNIAAFLFYCDIQVQQYMIEKTPAPHFRSICMLYLFLLGCAGLYSQRGEMFELWNSP